MKSRKGKRPLLACYTCNKCSMDTTLNSVKLELSIKDMKLVKSLIAWKGKSRKYRGDNKCEKLGKSRQFREIGFSNKHICKYLNEKNQVSGMVSVPKWHVTQVANVPWKPLTIR